MSEIRKYINLIESAMRIDESFKNTKEKFITQYDNEQEVKEYIEKFKELAKRNIIKGQDKDIGKWIKAGWESFKEFIDQSSTQQSKRQYKKKVKSDSITVYEDDEKIVVIPLSEKVSCYYGKNTQWCTAATNDNMFNKYAIIQRNIPFYVLMRDGSKFACMYNKHTRVFDCYDERDKSITEGNFKNQTGITRADMIGWYNEYKNPIEEAFSLDGRSDQTKEAAIRANPQAISELESPSARLIKIAIRSNPKNILLVQNPPIDSIVDAVVMQPTLASKFTDLPASAINKLLMKMPELYLQLDMFDNATTQMQIDAKDIKLVDNNISDITKIPNASEIVLWYAIEQNPLVVKYIHNYKNFNYAMYKAAVSSEPTVIRYGEPDDELLAHAAYHNPVVLSYYDNISDEVLEFIITEHDDAYQYIKNPSDYITDLQKRIWG